MIAGRLDKTVHELQHHKLRLEQYGIVREIKYGTLPCSCWIGPSVSPARPTLERQLPKA